MEEDAGAEYVGEVVRTPVFEKREIGELVVDGKEVVFRVLVVDWRDGPLYGWMVLGALDSRVDGMLGRSWASPRGEEEPAETRHATRLSFPGTTRTNRTDLSVNWTRGWQFGGAIAAHGPSGGGGGGWRAPIRRVNKLKLSSQATPAVMSKTAQKPITLKGSTAIVTDFFKFAVNRSETRSLSQNPRHNWLVDQTRRRVASSSSVVYTQQMALKWSKSMARQSCSQKTQRSNRISTASSNK